MRRRRRSYSAGEAARRRHSWLELVQQSGPFLTLPVVNRIYPDGLPEVRFAVRSDIRTAVVEMLDNHGASRRAVIAQVLAEALDWGDHLQQGHDLPAALAEPVPEYGTRVVPDFGFYVAEASDLPDLDDLEGDDGDEAEDDNDTEAADPVAEAEMGPWRMLGLSSAWGEHPLTRINEGGWTASPVERLAHLLRARDVPIGLVTDGRWWSLVWAPRGGTTGAAVWDAGLWSEEPDSFQAFVALLNRARFLAAAREDTLPQLFIESLAAQEEVTETLGRQVRDAVELLIATLDRLDAETGGRILSNVTDDALYDGVVTVMMRIVFLLFAEERRLLPSDDHLYVAAYSVGRLVEQLEDQATLAGEQTLEYRTGAWHRLLAVARALHSGVAHEDLRLPAYGGGLFDPDRYPWLEGRNENATAAAFPPAVDDRTVLRMLRAVQYVTIDGDRRRLTFRALDVEQIGYVYEGLLELEVRTATDVVLGLIRPPKWPKGKKEDACEVPLTEVETWLTPSHSQIALRLKARTGLTANKVEQAFQRTVPADEQARIVSASGGDPTIAGRILPIAGLLRFDERGQPAIALPGRRYIAPSTRRAATGTHYTPRSLAEDVVNNTLEPLVYRPGPLETSDRDTWQIRPSTEILDLRVADIAMGSGAFLVAACRYLADRLLEAWISEGKQDALLAERRRTRGLGSDADIEQVALDARRLVAEHCLYGVDINPLAVEMAKLSLWLITMDRERPFGFLDDRLVCGDSLLGLASVDQLETLHIDPVAGRKLTDGVFDFAAGWRQTLAQAADLRRRITAAPVTTVRDVEHKQRLLAEAQELSGPLNAIADALTGLGLRMAKANAGEAGAAFVALQLAIGEQFDAVAEQAGQDLQLGRPAASVPRNPIHWPLTFPEVFTDTGDAGFDAIVGNPPFSGGQKLSGNLGDDYLNWLQRWDGLNIKGSADLAARFVLRAERLLASRGQLGFITTNTLVQGATLRVGLLPMVARGTQIRRGQGSHPWPSSSANLEIVALWATRKPVATNAELWLDGEVVPAIGPDLEPVGRVSGRPFRLAENENLAFSGVKPMSRGFIVTAADAEELIQAAPTNAEVVRPYVIGKDLNQLVNGRAGRWIIDFNERSLPQAQSYRAPFSRVEQQVFPGRVTSEDRRLHDYWWLFERTRPEMRAAIASLQTVLALAQSSSSLAPLAVATDQVFDQKVIVFALEELGQLATLSSSAHTVWSVRYASTLRRDISYAVTDVFETFPRPPSTVELARLGATLTAVRRSIMTERSWGLTTMYNHVHDSNDSDATVQGLRDLHTDIDYAVLRAYRWEDLDPQIGHHPTKIGVRWTVSRDARFELLDRLLEANHRRYEAEQ